MDIIRQLTQELNIRHEQAEAAVNLLDDGNTVPFISRYRKDVTGGLNDEQLRLLQERLTYLRSLEQRREQILSSIDEQGKLTPQLKEQILAAQTLVSLEDLYLPYRPKRRTRASIARERGLEGLAKQILLQRDITDLDQLASSYIDPSKEVPDTASALAGASDILAEVIAERASFRDWTRRTTMHDGILTAKAKNPDVSTVYDMYYQFEETVKTVPGHRILALNRGESEKVLTVKIEAPSERILLWLESHVINGKCPAVIPFLKAVCADSYNRLLGPAVERDIRSELTEKAESGAIDVFGKNLKQLLMQPPIAGKTVLGWDPAFRTGCKLAVVDPSGKVLDTAVIFPTAPTNAAKQADAERTLTRMIKAYGVSVISVGNGTACRESESFIAQYLKKLSAQLPGADVKYVIVNEAGASVYSASKLAAQEFPEFDVGQRSAASIARRLQDPLAELVKIDPKSIGVGQYQHDINQKKLGETLDGVVEDCVNAVGVDLNTASAALLKYVSGISSSVAGNIVSWREANGPFHTRKELLKVPKLGAKAFEQCAGFLRIPNGSEPLDATGVHPESYEAARKLLQILGVDSSAIQSGGCAKFSSRISDPAQMADVLQIGELTLKDIASELEKPGRDPRTDMPQPILRNDVLEMEDLKEGMILKGTVRNVIDFGAFVDIGVHQDGLVHISQMKSGKFIKHPLEVVSVGDVIDVQVLSVDLKRKRISLTMKINGTDAGSREV